MTATTRDCTPLLAPAPRRTLNPFAWFFMVFTAWKQRRRLAELDDHLLKDIGLNPMDAKAEAARPLWDVPPGWRV